MVIIGELMGLYMIYQGFKKRKKKDIDFKIKHLFQYLSIKDSSGTQLFIEGAFIMIVGLAFYFSCFFLRST